MEVFLAILQGFGIFIVLPVIIGVIIISLALVFQQFRKQASSSVQEKLDGLVCSIDTDCPEGYVCVGGKCIPQMM